jgi:hypothetical protein
VRTDQWKVVVPWTVLALPFDAVSIAGISSERRNPY